jgi:outer membrane immunogenic protein
MEVDGMRSLIFLAASGLVVAPAMAAEPSPFEPVAPPAFEAIPTGPGPDWSGFYIGALFGYSFGDAETPVALNPDVDGIDGGLYAGAAYQFDRFVLGLEGDLLASGVEGSAGGLTVEQRWAGSLRGRAGIALDRFLLYGTGGLAATGVEASAGGLSDTNTLMGWTAGAGIEALIAPNVTARVEYRHSEYEDKTFTLGAPTAVDLSTDSIRAGVGVKF